MKLRCHFPKYLKKKSKAIFFEGFLLFSDKVPAICGMPLDFASDEKEEVCPAKKLKSDDDPIVELAEEKNLEKATVKQMVAWLRSHGIKCTPKDKKTGLIQKIRLKLCIESTQDVVQQDKVPLQKEP